MQDPVVTKSGGAFNIITMKGDIASLSGKIGKQESLGQKKIADTQVSAPEPKKILREQQLRPTIKDQFQKSDSVFEYKKTNSFKPQNVVDPDLIEISSHEVELDVPPPPPMPKLEKDFIHHDLETPPPMPKEQKKELESLEDEFELQIKTPEKQYFKKISEDIASSEKIESEKESIEKTFKAEPGEQNPLLEKVIFGEPEPLTQKATQIKDSREDDLQLYDKKEIINPQIVKSVKEELQDAVIPDQIQEKTTISKPVPEQKIEPVKQEVILDPVAQKLLEIEKEKEKIKEERKIVYADCKNELSEIEIQKEKQNKIKFDLLGKIKDIKFNELNPLLDQEESIQKNLSIIKEKEKTVSTLAQEEKIFQERAEQENERQDIEKKRWSVEDRIQGLKNQVKEAEDQLDNLSKKERDVNERREKFNAKVEKIEIQEKRWILQKELNELKSNQEKISNEYADLLPEKDRLNNTLREALLSKTDLEKQINDLEVKEAQAQKEEKRNFEKQRQEKEKQRQEASKKALQDRREKENIEKRISELSSIIQSSNAREKEILSRIETLEKALQENFNRN
ncbi:MAG TPA: hypothetical protein PLA41_00670 [Candidatus Pacearchaeota archaeon]|nr:hypothetical protein [Candidatus Pacearchaeota archaeon]HPM08287.1 hypothetical protein [Candidatus Pacearchaeota archaeon]HQI74580.1 hypothetical protein [Candidatus Pacearchaeota archaeon]